MLTWTRVFSLWKEFTPTWNQSKSRIPLRSFTQFFTEKPVFECVFAHPIMLFLLYLVKNSMECVSVICKLDKKWYLMHMCASWLRPFKNQGLEYQELLQACFEKEIKLSEKHWLHTEEDTRSQSQGTKFYKHQAGRIGASQSKVALYSNPALAQVSNSINLLSWTKQSIF